MKGPGTHLSLSLCDKIYNERSLIFPLPQSENRQQIALKMMSMDKYIYIYIYIYIIYNNFNFLFTVFFFHIGEKSSSDAPLRGIVNDAFREF